MTRCRLFSSPQCFLRARKWQRSTPSLRNATTTAEGKGPLPPDVPTGWQIYSAAATLEWEGDRSKPDIPCKIFELVRGGSW